MKISITETGACAGKTELQTAAVQSAIDACAAQGGGTVVIPPGTFRTGTLHLKSDLVLYLEPGAVLAGPSSIVDYEKIPFPWDLYPCTLPLLYAEHARNIRIEGAGTIDFNGRAFACREKVCVADSVPEAFREDAHYEMPPRDRRPNRLAFFNSCEDVEISGVTLLDSPTWTLVFHRSKRLNFHDLRIENDLRIPNNDGIHCCGCEDVIVRGCFFRCGDDCIAVTSISDPSAVNERFLISDCIFQSRSAAVRIGFQAGKVRDVRICSCMIHDSNRGVAVFAGKGGFVENVSIDGLTAETRLHCGYWWGKGEPLAVCSSDADSPIRGLSVRNLAARSENGIVLSGVGGSVSQICLENIDLALSYGQRRKFVPRVIDLAPNPVKEAPDPDQTIPWLYQEGTADVRTSGIRIRKNGNFSTEAMNL